MSYLVMSSLMSMHATKRFTLKGRLVFHTDSYTDPHTVGINNQCSACTSPDILDFIGSLEPADCIITGFAGPKVHGV